MGKLSGPVGTYSNIDPAIEARVLPELGLRPADVATQVVFRDGIAEWVSVLALLATACEAVALEVRHGQRTEVRELAEAFSAGQKGSSSMPHKRNPIRSERICGLARVVRGYVTPVMEGMALWHERDISHSSVERVALPDAAIATDYLLHLTTGLIGGLRVDAARMRANLESTGGLIYTSSVLLDLVAAGMSREDAYALVQAAAADSWDTGDRFPGGAAQRRPRPGRRSTRPAWTRFSGRNTTSRGSGRSSTGWPNLPDRRGNPGHSLSHLQRWRRKPGREGQAQDRRREALAGQDAEPGMPAMTRRPRSRWDTGLRAQQAAACPGS